MLKISSQAPHFRSLDQDGKEVSLTDFMGKYVVLYFYPKDDTPGCTLEACGLRDSYEALQKLAVVIGVSADSVESHKKFATKYHLPFTLLADTSKEIITLYGANGLFTKRITYIINPSGEIIKLYPNVNPSQHAKEIFHDLEALRADVPHIKG